MPTKFYKKASINYSSIGWGKTIVFLHGLLENQTMWDSFVAFFSNNYRVITIDLLGHGKTDCLGYCHTMDENACAVNAVLTQLGVERAVFVGHSMGGYVALSSLSMFPKLVSGLVLLNSTAYNDDEQRKKTRTQAIRIASQEYENLIKLSIVNLFNPDKIVQWSEAIASVQNQALKTPLRGYIATQEGLKIRRNQLATIEFSNVPKLLVLGKKDTVLNYFDTIKMVEKTNFEIITYPDGHMSHIENQAELLEDLKVFLEKI